MNTKRTQSQAEWRRVNHDRIYKTQREWRKNNPLKVAASRRKHMLGNLERYLLGKIRLRANKEGIRFNLTVDDVGKIPKRCPIFGIVIRRGVGRSSNNSPTLDRLNPKKGYTKGNVAWISNLANQLKSNATAAQHRRIADWMNEFLATQPKRGNK